MIAFYSVLRYTICMDQENYSKTLNASNFWYAHSYELEPDKDSYYRHNHSRYELYIFLEGDLDFIVEDRVMPLKSGTVVLIRPFQYHYAMIKASTVYHRIICNFDRSLVYPELYSFLDGGRELFVWDDARYRAAFHDLESHLGQYSTGDAALLVQIYLNRLLMDLKYRVGTPPDSHMLNPAVSRILKFINGHIYEPLSLKTIAQQLYMSTSYLSQTFSTYMKTGLMDYVKQKKIQLAQQLIVDEHIHPTEACKRLGFDEYSTFYRLYKKYVHELPSDGK